MFRALCAHHQEVKIVCTASGIITPIVGRPVLRLREQSSLNRAGRSGEKYLAEGIRNPDHLAHT